MPKMQTGSVTTRGGARPGAGRKPKDSAAGLKRRTVILDDASVAILRNLGNGELSLGIRLAARRMAETIFKIA